MRVRLAPSLGVPTHLQDMSTWSGSEVVRNGDNAVGNESVDTIPCVGQVARYCRRDELRGLGWLGIHLNGHRNWTIRTIGVQGWRNQCVDNDIAFPPDRIERVEVVLAGLFSMREDVRGMGARTCLDPILR